MAQDDDKYTDPELRAEIKEDIHASDKGGQPGQWSARKAQLTAAEYKKAMEERGEEPYTTDKSELSENQKHLTKWGEEDWQTSDGSGHAKQEDGTERRYLPKKAWENMTEEEKQETEEMKLEGSKEGNQHVPNSDAAKKARKEVTDDVVEASGAGTKNGAAKNGTDHSASGTKHKREEAEVDDGDDGSSKATKKAKGDDGEKIVTKSSTDEEQRNGIEASNELEDSGTGSQADEGGDEHGKPGSSERLPKEGQNVHWKVGRNWTEGAVVDILYEEKEVDGIHAKASQDEPRVVLKSAKSGKTAVHKPDAVFF